MGILHENLISVRELVANKKSNNGIMLNVGLAKISYKVLVAIRAMEMPLKDAMSELVGTYFRTKKP